MRKIVIDIENTTTSLGDRYRDYSPYNPNNKLVSIGWMVFDANKLTYIDYVFLHHNELASSKVNWKDQLYSFKEDLKKAEIIIAHNAKYDISWLEEAGFDLSHLKIEDTMIREYVMARGRTDFSFRLADTCKRYKVAEKGELFEKYPDLQISEMPIAEVEEYGRADIQACAELYLAQEDRLKQDGYKGMQKTIDMMNEFCRVLVDMERNGVKIDEEMLSQVEADYTGEAEQLKFDLNVLIKKYMGDTPVNLDSPQQLSEVIYSRTITHGKEEEWVRVFNIGKDDRNKPLRRPKMSLREYVDQVKRMTNQVMKTTAQRCDKCNSVGTYFRTKKDGSNFKKATKCKACDGSGIVYLEKNEIAGFRMKPMNVYFTTVAGFTTSQTFLDELIAQAKESGKNDAAVFLQKLQRLSSVSSYLSNFVGGIKIFKQSNNILHPNYNQCITATGRLSSTKPNLQNQPRESTFPVRKCFVSKFEGGCLIDTDFRQLEFCAAVHLAKDEKGKEDILNGVDLHLTTAKIITEAGQNLGRQEAKSRTFKPLYAGTTGTEAEREYYRKFLKEIYTGIGAWHKELEEEAIFNHIITTETGRQFIFPDVERAWHGGATRKTQIVNYPVQSFATADVAPIATIRLHKEMKNRKLKSVIILNVHDSIIVDTYPGEEKIVIELMNNIENYVKEELEIRYNIVQFVPFRVETKIGRNLMELKKVA